MPVDTTVSRENFFGLNTDNAPDDMGDAAFRLSNVLPASKNSIKSRNGVSLVKHDQPGTQGRSIVVDGAPSTDGTGLLITVIEGDLAATASGAAEGDVDETQIGNFFYRPPIVATEYQTVQGIPSSTSAILIAF